jgi:hypothetical protein
MAKPTFQPNPRVRQIFNDLELYQEFCADYGYRFDESTLYDMRNYAFQQFSKYSAGKNFKDQWADDARKLGCLI